ncbi:MAG TPA: phage tail tube protein [Selenomonadales bacterium]|nr:phage tail tube protein [Selenomonadales bacterium]
MGDAIRTMHAKDVIAAKLASCYITIDGNRYLLMQAKSLEAKIEKDKQEVPILGRTGKGHKTVSWNGTGSMTIYANTSLFTKLLKTYKDTGQDFYFDIQITNEDTTSAAGRQTIILKDCNLDSGIIAAFDADGDWLEQDVDFTFEDFEMPEEFNQLDGMR